MVWIASEQFWFSRYYDHAVGEWRQRPPLVFMSKEDIFICPIAIA